jgi:glycosyltransferase involved in cell wall biosynthesis
MPKVSTKQNTNSSKMGKINQLCSNEDRAKQMGEEGYQRGVDLYDAEKNIAQIMKIYGEILKQSNTQGR